MTVLGELANFSALSNPDITGIGAKEGFTPEETANLNFKAILTDLFTVGTPQCGRHLKFLEPARAKGVSELEAYHGGNVQPLAQSLARTLRLLNREVASMTMANPIHTLNTLTITGRVLNALQENRELMDHSGLNGEELEETRRNLGLYAVMRKGMEAKRTILEHSLYRKNLTPAQLQQAGLDVLFAESVLVNIRSEHSNVSKEIAATDAHKAIIREFQAEDLSPERKEAAGNRMELLNMKRPALETLRQLSDPNWVAERRASLQASSKLNTLPVMNRDELGKMFSASSKDLFAGLSASKEPQPLVKTGEAPQQQKLAGMQVNF